MTRCLRDLLPIQRAATCCLFLRDHNNLNGWKLLIKSTNNWRGVHALNSKVALTESDKASVVSMLEEEVLEGLAPQLTDREDLLVMKENLEIVVPGMKDEENFVAIEAQLATKTVRLNSLKFCRKCPLCWWPSKINKII